MSRQALIERMVRELASYERPSASDGERRAADQLAGEFRASGCRRVRVEEERARGGYWWPLGLLNAGSAAAALLGRRAAALAGGAAAAAVYDDVGGGKLWFRSGLLRSRPTWNVVAEVGDPQAARSAELARELFGRTPLAVGRRRALVGGKLAHHALNQGLTGHRRRQIT